MRIPIAIVVILLIIIYNYNHQPGYRIISEYSEENKLNYKIYDGARLVDTFSTDGKTKLDSIILKDNI
jgi:hypothetical protein